MDRSGCKATAAKLGKEITPDGIPKQKERHGLQLLKLLHKIHGYLKCQEQKASSFLTFSAILLRQKMEVCISGGNMPHAFKGGWGGE